MKHKKEKVKGMYCKHCGKEIPNGAAICPHCGCWTEEAKKREPTTADKTNTGFTVLGALFPVIGLILYLIWMEDFPLRAKSAAKGAIIDAAIYVSLIILNSLFFHLSLTSLLTLF